MIKTISTLKDFLKVLQDKDNSQLVFSNNGKEINPDYHVTELKSAAVRSIDCGRNLSEWTETIIQLLDGPQSIKGEHMTAFKFSQIATASIETVPALADGALWFEYAPGNGPIRKLSVSSVQIDGDRIKIQLGGAAAACKPRKKWLENAQASDLSASSGCCGSKSSICCAA
ncbi:MAG: hypothetical protein JKX94_02920 [Sneathiella sp.]|nr:hypothetical protein [Sneathiella sp.]